MMGSAEEIRELLHRLSERERTVIERRADGFTYREIGNLWGLSRSRIQQIEGRAARKIRALIRQADRALLVSANLRVSAPLR